MTIVAWLLCLGALFISIGIVMMLWGGLREISVPIFATGFSALGVLLIAMAILFLASSKASARDLDGRYAGSKLHDWFEGLSSQIGRCCSELDGSAVADPDWNMQGNHYRVRIAGHWLDVPDEAMITVPNLSGRAMVWAYIWDDPKEEPTIRCFMAGPTG
jgi:hypothetical protein